MKARRKVWKQKKEMRPLVSTVTNGEENEKGLDSEIYSDSESESEESYVDDNDDDDSPLDLQSVSGGSEID